MQGSTIAERIEAVRGRMARACERAGRAPESVRLVAVSKTHGPGVVREAADCGIAVFGENKVQEAAAKIPLCPGHLKWHLVGHLQRNKVRQAVQLFDMIHSVDSVRLLETVDRGCADAGRTVPVLIEVNVSGDPAKYGLKPDDLPAMLESATRCLHVDVMGLMTMPPWTEDPARTRPHFKRLRELRDRCAAECGFPLPELSMGMSHDFEAAIEEGATWIRVGTDLFGERKASATKDGSLLSEL